MHKLVQKPLSIFAWDVLEIKNNHYIAQAVLGVVGVAACKLMNGSPILSRAITNEKLVKAGYYVLAVNYEFKRLKHYGI